MAKKMYGLNVSLADEAAAQMLKVVIGYEAARRGMSQGQVLEHLVTKAVNLDTYPPEVLTRLNEISERRRRKAVEESLAIGRRERIA